MTSQFDRELAILRERYQHNLVAYREQLQQTWASLQAAPRVETLTEMSSLAHRLVGSGKAYGFDKLSGYAKNLEHICEQAKSLPPQKMSTELSVPVARLLLCLSADGRDGHLDGSSGGDPAGGPTPAENKDKITILVVDDDTDFCDKLCHMLRNHGYQVFSLNAIADFDAAVSRYAPRAVIVDMDFYGSRFAGAQTVFEWRQRSGEPIPVIFISGFDSFDLRLAAVRAGGNYFLSKPLDQSRLLLLLNAELDLRPEDPYRVLLVDDDRDLLNLYESTLTQAGYAVHTASGATDALILLEQEVPDLVLIDVYMPDCNGIELGQLIRQHERFAHIPLLFMSAAADTDIKLACARLVNDEFINKPIEPWRLVMVVKSRSARNRHRLTKNVTPEASQAEHLQDPLTALPALKTFRQSVQTRLNALKPGQLVAVLKLDIRDFHTVNNLYGHFTGDQVLQRLAWELSQCLSADDLLSRESGDEFLVLTATATTTEALARLANSLSAATGKPMQFGDQRMVVLSADIGVVVAPLDADNADDLLRYADTALFAARKSTHADIRYFDAAMRHAEKNRFNLDQEIRQALQSGEFVAAYQPIFSVANGSLLGFEALARWQHPDRGLVAPADFMPILEDRGLVSHLTNRMLELALQQLARWRATHAGLFMSVNLSARDIQSPNFIDELRKLIALYQLPPESIVLEITETALLADWQHATVTINALKALGVKLALDDFGTGYSSLSYLHRIQASTLKIDRSFIHDWSQSRDEGLLQTMIQLGHGTGMIVVGEGVETADELELLKRIGCDSYQGFLSSKPMFEAELILTEWFSAGHCRLDGSRL